MPSLAIASSLALAASTPSLVDFSFVMLGLDTWLIKQGVFGSYTVPLLSGQSPFRGGQRHCRPRIATGSTKTVPNMKPL